MVVGLLILYLRPSYSHGHCYSHCYNYGETWAKPHKHSYGETCAKPHSSKLFLACLNKNLRKK